MIVGLYLPQLLKLEVGAVKFEKNATEPISKDAIALGLKWKTQRQPVLGVQLWNPPVASTKTRPPSVTSQKSTDTLAGKTETRPT
jgi:hypothetical protein